MQFKIYFPLLFLTLFCSVTILGQSSKRQVLEARRTQIQKDIIYINALLSNTKRKESNLLSEVKDLKDKAEPTPEEKAKFEAETGLRPYAPTRTPDYADPDSTIYKLTSLVLFGLSIAGRQYV